MNNCNCAMCHQHKLVDYSLIKSIGDPRIGGTGSSAMDMDELLEKARKAAQDRKDPQRRREELEDQRIKTLQDKPNLTRGEEVELLFLLERKWQRVIL